MLVVHLQKIKKDLKNLCRQETQNLFTKFDLDKACFQHDMAYVKSKDLTKRTQSDEVLRDKAFQIASNPKCDGYQRGLASMVYKFFDKKSSAGAIQPGPYYQLANELDWQVIRKLREEKFICLLETISGALI